MKSQSLLEEACFRVIAADGSRCRLSLPDVIGRLSEGEDLVFLALRPHQQAAWHAFLVQLACLSLEVEGWPELPTSGGAWARLLRALTPAWPGDEPWLLFNSDSSQPAFLQSPGKSADYRSRIESAQELDLLVTSKNHDEKIGKLCAPDDGCADVWIYALISLQGFAGYLGRGNFSTMRMNGGFASRPQFRLVFEEGSGAEFVRDVQALRECMEDLLDDAAAQAIGTDRPLSLLWLEPWGDAQLPLSRVHPLCLEVTRRVRLHVRDEGGFRASAAGSVSMRVAAKDNRGQVLDPWIPIIKEGDPRALTAQADTFSYHRLAPLLFDEQRCLMPRLARPTIAELDAAAPAMLRAQVLVGGSGRTDGCLRRDVVMPLNVLRRVTDRRGELARRARAYIELAAVAQGKVLRAALLQYVDGSDDVDWQNKDFGRAVSPWIAALERRIDEVYFDALFATEADPPMLDAEARQFWARQLRVMVEDVFRSAVRSLPTRDRSREMAGSRAERLLRNAMTRHLGDDPPAPEAVSKPRPSRKTNGQPGIGL